MTQNRFAVVTPYYQEPRAILERCTASVRAQTRPCDHFLIADGFPQAWIDERQARHISLDQPHKDYGNVARGIGALLAVSEAYDGIGFLDAEIGWTRIMSRLASGRAGAAPISSSPSAASCGLTAAIFTSPKNRAMSTPAAGGSSRAPIIAVVLGDDAARSDADRRSGLLGPHRSLAPQGKRNLQDHGELHLHVGRRVSALRETPPPGAKPDIDLPPVLEWLSALPDAKRRVVARLCAGDLVPWAQKTLAELKAAKSS